MTYFQVCLKSPETKVRHLCLFSGLRINQKATKIPLGKHQKTWLIYFALRVFSQFHFKHTGSNS
jgi:hypothetical protein